MKILITGSNGLLGQKLVKYCVNNNLDFFAISIGENRNTDCPEDKYEAVDITNRASVFELLQTVQPTNVIHTAAITNVDFCELNPEDCTLVNVKGTEYLIDAANEVKACFQFLSTDFVFDGIKGNYNEQDEVNPLSIYARSKVDGENLVKERSAHGWTIVRTIIVYGVGNNLSRSNLIVWAKNSLENGIQMNIIDDQFRAPTYAEDLAKGCLKIIEKKEHGIFHLCGPETMSIHEIVSRIARHYNYSMSSVNKVSSKTLNQPAKRPPKTGFDLSKAINKIDYKPSSIEDSLDRIFH